MKILGIVVGVLLIGTGVLGSEKHNPKTIQYELTPSVTVYEFKTTTGSWCFVVTGNLGGLALHCDVQRPLGGLQDDSFNTHKY